MMLSKTSMRSISHHRRKTSSRSMTHVKRSKTVARTYEDSPASFTCPSIDLNRRNRRPPQITLTSTLISPHTPSITMTIQNAPHPIAPASTPSRAATKSKPSFSPKPTYPKVSSDGTAKMTPRCPSTSRKRGNGSSLDLLAA